MAKKNVGKHTDTTITLAPLTVDEALGALLKTPPPPAEREAVKAPKKRKATGKKKTGVTSR